MGELRGGRPDQPEEQPEPRATPARPRDRVRSDPDSNNNPDAIRRAMKASDAFDRRSPDIDPPSGKDLAEMDAPGASRGDRFRKRLTEKLEDSHDALDKVGEIISGVGRNPPGHSEVRTPKPVMENPTPHGIEGGQALTGMFVTGILLGEAVRRAYRMAHR